MGEGMWPCREPHAEGFPGHSVRQAGSWSSSGSRLQEVTAV